ncbi:hypothetical protein DT076_15430 [Desertihabitans brevis]|uniref:YoaR-like putative peptidoglycan binding domain-containing protein n=1 Tax=Desertihabitans brevis TaxID=2268447 RepID=A0A367YRU6_9ACTN|nr:VanW family protein [Desertihabitans brevis]RCK68615.1 hypothetical protein DT076_15430 [Desertihabitans brevis]
MTSTDSSRPRRNRALVPVVAVATVLLVLGGIYVAGYLLAGDRVPRNATVAGVAIGGMARAEAVSTLQRELADEAGAPLTVSADGATREIVPAEAGLALDAEASVEAAGAGRSWNPLHIWQVLTGGGAQRPLATVDEEALAQAVDAYAEAVEGEPKNATLGYDGTAVEVGEGSSGITIDREATATALSQTYLRGTTVAAAATVTPPEVTTEEAEQVAEEVAEPAVSDDVTVRAGDAGEFEVSPEAIAGATTFEIADGTYVARYDAGKLREGSEEAIDELDITEPRDAYWTLRGGRPQLVEAVDGTTVDAEKLLAAVEPVLTRQGEDRTATVELTPDKADFTTEEAKKAQVTEVVGQFTTSYDHADYRNINLGEVAERVDNHWLAPGETFSMNDVVGERTAANGFVDGYVIQGGVLKKESGGGVSQAATTLFNAAFFAGLEDVEHHPHTLYFDRYPAGREATVYYGSLDLQFKNNTPYGVIIEADRKKSAPGSRGSLTVKIWSTRVWDEVRSPDAEKTNFTSGRELTKSGPSCEYQAPIQGFDATYYRAFIKDGKEVKRENYFWRYSPGDEIKCE